MFSNAISRSDSVLAKLLHRLEHRTGLGEIMPGLDGIRAVAITLVFGFHAHAFSGSPSLPLWPQGPDLAHLLGSGFLGVDLFFVLSGFLLLLPWAKAFYLKRPSPSPGRYYRRRILRILPAYYVHLLVLFLFLVPWVYSFAFLFSGEGLWNLFAHAFFLQFLFPSTATGMGINGALWTLTIEAQFYLMLPLVAPFFLGKRAWAGLAAALAIALAWKYLSQPFLADMLLAVAEKTHPAWYDPFSITVHDYPPPMMGMFLNNQFPSQAFHFAIGMAFANLYAWHHYAGRKLAWMEGLWGGLIGLAAVMALLGMAWNLYRMDITSGLWHYAWHILFATVCAMLIGSIAFNNPLSRLFSIPLMRIPGIISYSLYLWHVPVFFVVFHHLYPLSLEGTQAFLYMAGVCGFVAGFIAFISYIWIEKPFMERREGSKKPALAYAPKQACETG